LTLSASKTALTTFLNQSQSETALLGFLRVSFGFALSDHTRRLP
jgi:hypothetical protein